MGLKQIKMQKSIFACLLGVFLLQGCYYDNKEDLYQFIQPTECNITTAAYSTDVLPILDAYCLRCHRNVRQDGNVNLEGYTNAKIYAEDGSLLGSVNHDAGFFPMPSNGGKLPACEIEVIRLWVTDGYLNN